MIRRATRRDFIEHYKMLCGFWGEQNIAGLTFTLSHVKVKDYIHLYLDCGVVFSAYDGDELQGSIALYKSPLWWTEELMLRDGWFYVKPEHRRTAGLELLNAAEEYAEEENLPLMIGVLNSVDQDRKDMFFQRKGFNRVGGWYVRSFGDVLQRSTEAA